MRHPKVFVPSLLLMLAAGLALATTALAGELTGTVVTASGNPVPSVWVVVTQGATTQGRFLTGDDGKYYIGNLASGQYQAKVKRGDTVLMSRNVSVPGNYDLSLP